MEEKRRQLMSDSQLYADLVPLGRPKANTSSDIISVSSTSSGPSQTNPISVNDSEDENFRGIPRSAAPPRQTTEPLRSLHTPNGPLGIPRSGVLKAKRNIVLSDDEDDMPVPGTTVQRQVPHRPPQPTGAPVPIHIPTNRDVPPPSLLNKLDATKAWSSSDAKWEFFDPNVNDLHDPRTTAAEAEKALRDLFQDSVNDDSEAIDMSLAVIDGFRDDVRLLPHQVQGTLWMKDRESGKKTGGILADDMGLGKTIQSIARIVDGRPRKSDKEAGWAASTLVVCPVSLVSQWASEIQKIAIGLRVIEHHGGSRTRDPDKLRRAHVVITSYSIVSSEHAAFLPAEDHSGSKGKGKKKAHSDESGSDAENSDTSAEHFGRTLAKKAPAKKKVMDAIFHVKWFRIILDEAHNIKNRNTKAAQACFSLQSKYKWCLTGTPMQNGVEELFSLLKFLGIRPLNDWQTFNEQIAKPVKAGRSVRAMKRLQVVLKAIMLRRKKDQILNGKPLIELPARLVEVVQCEFEDDEREFYNSLESRVEETVQQHVQAGDFMKSYTVVLVMLLRLRQACNHALLINKDFSHDRDALESRPASTKDNDDDGLADLMAGLGVGQTTRKCQVCQIELDDDGTATHCRKCMKIAEVARRKSIGGVNNLPPTSAKIRKILELIRDIDDRSDGEEKTIVFSQFTSMLDLIQMFLKAEGMKSVRYDGSMSKDQREASLEKIRKSSSTRIILISFKAGGVGLNLTACNNVILVDLWWNPALEDQAFDRAHRFGQKRDVHIYKLTIPLTVEDRILMLQDKKRELSAAALSGDKIKNNKLGMDDLMALFRPGGRDDDDDDED